MVKHKVFVLVLNQYEKSGIWGETCVEDMPIDDFPTFTAAKKYLMEIAPWYLIDTNDDDVQEDGFCWHDDCGGYMPYYEIASVMVETEHRTDDWDASDGEYIKSHYILVPADCPEQAREYIKKNTPSCKRVVRYKAQNGDEE